MSKRKTKHAPPDSSIGLICPDQVTAEFVETTLKKCDVSISWRGIGAKATQDFCRNGTPSDTSTLFLVPSPRLGDAQIALVTRIVRSGGHVVAWQAKTDRESAAPTEEWLSNCFVEQAGAIAQTEFRIAKTLIQMLTKIRFPRSPAIRLKGPSSALGNRIECELRARGLKPTKRRNASLSIDFHDEPVLIDDAGGTLPFRDPSDISIALRALLDSASGTVPKASVSPDARVLDAIAKPPARLLSETTSKKVISTVGISGPREQLCKSPTRAVAFAASISGPVVAKLVMPALTNKSQINAVKKNVQGPSAVRRAVHSLQSLATDRGPTKSLGILVSEQVDGGDRVWLKMDRSDRFGRYILLGPGDSPNGIPAVALRMPVSSAQAHSALRRCSLASSSKKSQALGVSITRFSTLLMEMGDRVERAEIHPLVASDDGKDAVALDALIGIAESGRSER